MPFCYPGRRLSRSYSSFQPRMSSTFWMKATFVLVNAFTNYFPTDIGPHKKSERSFGLGFLPLDNIG